MNTVKDIAGYIKEGGSFLIATHINPEGDAIGSAVALSMALEALGKKNIVYDKDGVPGIYGFMPGSERIISSLEGIDTKSLCLIILDCNDLERAGLEGMSFGRTAVIDHHATERDFGQIRWIEPEAPACGLMVYRLIKELGVKVTKEMAVNLYTAIAVDTGTFRHGNTTSAALEAAAELVGAGAEPGQVAEDLYATWSEGRFKLFCRTLGTLEITDGVAVMTITSEMMHDTGASPDDVENFVSYPRTIKDLKVSALLRQVDADSWKVSLRSKKDFNVAAVAESFGGGGHRNAAGFKIRGNLKTAKEMLLERLNGQG
ncbi:MAG: bifunctional oligoribonuclease/PAP phosphatase NrnA [Thermodesulfovibrionales bacterium]|nr:bifunctional oligoribonuclease/PAP phosphatase NrnA [Thermodesulfovibrionales bacterium]